MGSTVLAWPALRELQAARPGVELHFLVFGDNREILDALALVPPAQIISIPADPPRAILAGAARAVRRLARLRLDAVLDFDLFSRFSAVCAFLVCRGARVGFHRYTSEGLGRGRLLTHPVLYSAHLHISAAFTALVRALLEDRRDLPLYRAAVAPAGALPRYTPAPGVRARVAERLRAGGLDPGRQTLVLVNANASDIFPLRRWPLARFAEVCRRLLREGPDVRVVLTGTASEQKDADVILAHVQDPRCVSLCGRTSLAELLALYSLAALLISNDSGPPHFAALLELPSIVLFGPETPALYGPLNPKARCLYAGFACSPCVSVHNAKRSPCGRSLCLEAISVDEVLTAARAALSAARAAH
jgi:ADP-heptose:LPS heptosyltransferase